MIRRIVLVRGSDPLSEGWSRKSFASAGPLLDARIKVLGMRFDESYHPVPVTGRVTPADMRPAAAGFNYRGAGRVGAFCLRMEFDDEDAIERMRTDRRADVVGVYADLTLRPFPASPYCGAAAVGNADDVAKKLGVPALRSAGLTGKKVRIAVVDTGIDGKVVPVVGGWAPVPGYVPGTTPKDHGTMCAWDVRISAPDASILDYALLKSEGNTWTAFLSDAISAFADLIDLLGRQPGSLVVTNSWGLFDRSEDAPIGSPENYSANPDHPFNQIVGSLVAAGADVFFAAGNCGADCPDGRCGVGDRGPGASIHGANSHPSVVTVAGVTVQDRRLGYSSQGPGGLADRKPDLAGLSHFKGSGVYPADSGTSAACPVAAGVAVALRQKVGNEKLAPAQLKGLLQRTARDLEQVGWDYNVGYGVIDAAAAVKGLGLKPAGAKGRRPKKAAGKGGGPKAAAVKVPKAAAVKVPKAAAAKDRGTKRAAAKSRGTRRAAGKGKGARAAARKA